jgi:membrane protein
MPNVRTRAWSALVGGAVGGLLWQAALFLHVDLQSGVAQYNALYAGFAAFPIFLVWLYVSWQAVLLGAALAATHQHQKRVRYAMRTGRLDPEARELLAVAIAVEVAARFTAGAAPPDEEDLARGLGVPPAAVEEALAPLTGGGLLVRVLCGRGFAFTPSRDLNTIQLWDIHRAVRCRPGDEDIKGAVRQALAPAVRDALDAAERSSRQAEREVTLQQLAERSTPHLDGSPVPGRETRPEVLDAKQPEVPA